MELKKISVVILNYNSESDLIKCTQNIVGQEGIQLSVIIVDNASKQSCVKSIKNWLLHMKTNVILGGINDIEGWRVEHNQSPFPSGQVFFIENSINNGYSAGNNIGIHLAKQLQSEAVLIANPDMRFDDNEYILKLSNTLFSDKSYSVAASKITGLDGKDQNPLREATFWEEVLWPKIILYKIFKQLFNPLSYLISHDSIKPLIVTKVSGCCLMIKMNFLEKIGWLDENVFLYCEEPILSAQVKREGNKMIYVPSISAVHAHKKSEKGNSCKRMLFFIKSRKYYLNIYSNYKNWQLIILSLSYLLLGLYYKTRLFLNR